MRAALLAILCLLLPACAFADLMYGHTRVSPLGDYPNLRMLLVVGANPVVSHGHTWALSNPVDALRELATRARVWVMDPRRTETVRLAHGHVRARSGTDFAVLAFLVRAVLESGLKHPWRFLAAGYSIPKALIEVEGKPIVRHVVER